MIGGVCSLNLPNMLFFIKLPEFYWMHYQPQMLPLVTEFFLSFLKILGGVTPPPHTPPSSDAPDSHPLRTFDNPAFINYQHLLLYVYN